MASDRTLIAPLVASGLATDGVTLWAADWAYRQMSGISILKAIPR